MNHCAARKLLPHAGREILQLAYVKGCRVEHVILPFNVPMHKGREWLVTAEAQTFAFSGDILQAFDHLGLDIVEKALRWALPENCLLLVSAILHELQFQSIEVLFQDVDFGEPVTYNRCIRTGGKDGPFIWKITMWYLFHMLVEGWKAAGIGVDLDAGRALL